MISYSVIIVQLKKFGLLVEFDNTEKEIFFEKLETDSRLISVNDVFVCISGFETDGHDFAASAVKNGAKLLICEKKLNLPVLQIVVKNSRRSAALLAKLFFGNPSAKFKLIGITGTNGKTTISHLVEFLLRKAGKKTGLIGTLGYYIDGKHFPLERTTPDIIELNRILVKMVSAKTEFVIMEVSSHSLALERVFGLEFDAALLTNITHDHLDFHRNQEKYAEAKFKLFRYTEANGGVCLFNLDDDFGKIFFEKIAGKKFGISFVKADYIIKNWRTNLNGGSFDLLNKNKYEKFETGLSGKFNIFNSTAALTIISQICPQIPISLTKENLRNFRTVSGRLERVPNRRNLNIFVDYAHTPNALENVLKTLSALKKRKIITVFGAGGNRDRGKRPLMLSAALKYSDLTIVTTDNPRREQPEEIIREIVRETSPLENYWIVTDRKEAIRTAVSLASEDDIVLVAGKGHEKYQEIDNRKFTFDDKEEAQNACKSTNKSEKSMLAVPIDTLELEILFSGDRISQSRLLTAVSTDSRNIMDNSLFFALKGENFDGHDFVAEVLKHKNCCAVVSDNNFKKIEKTIFVKDTLEALDLLAEKYKSLFTVKTIALTGSVGKTTTKEYIANVLSEIAPTLKTFGNENNLIGLPRTIFRLQPHHKFAVLELGSNHFGEIEKLAEICRPEIGIVTSIGAAHLEFFRDLKGVFQEKSSLLRRKLEMKIFPDDENFSEFDGITFGFSSLADYRISKVKSTEKSTEFSVNSQKFSIPTPFDKFVPNAAVAVALASEIKIPANVIINALQKPLSTAQRMEIIPRKNGFILNDCYNANPDSMKAALDFWLKFKTEKPHIAVLGDMLELGEKTEFFHREIGEILKNKNIESLISVGDFSRNFGADFHFPTVEKFIDSKIVNSFSANSVILLKASHSIGLEKLISHLR